MQESNGRVLLVEDDSDITALFQFLLENSGYQVVTAATVAQALAALQTEAVNLLLTDWSLPDGTAQSVCEEAHSHEPSVPVVIVSGVAPCAAQRVNQCLADAYLTKPVMPQDLIKSVAQLLAAR